MISGWWITKVACGLLLVGHFIAVATGLYSPHSLAVIPVRIAQTFVIVGAVLTIAHYILLKSVIGILSPPAHLVTSRGLFRLVRHPMYLGDLILYAGLAMFTCDPFSLALLVVGNIAIVGQCGFEDRMLRETFGDKFDAWKRQTRLLIPRLF
jgi:protein-S-isoprenylcysteine O-methyltransferase Ste14